MPHDKDVAADIDDQLRHIEHRRVQSLLDVDIDTFHELHDDAYQLCNPTGAVWDKAEYLANLTSGRLDYLALEPVGELDVLHDGGLAVVRYRCEIEMRLDGMSIPRHELRHLDVYTRQEDQPWRCLLSQATAVAASVDSTPN
jgi:uncharacterized protein DUF4440